MTGDTPTPVAGAPSPIRPPPIGVTPEDAFVALWDALTDVMGAAATATLMRRAMKRAHARSSEPDPLVVTRERFEYRYVLPGSWKTESAESMSALRQLARELGPLLTELTGAVVLHRLRAVPEIERCKLFSSEADR